MRRHKTWSDRLCNPRPSVQWVTSSALSVPKHGLQLHPSGYANKKTPSYRTGLRSSRFFGEIQSDRPVVLVTTSWLKWIVIGPTYYHFLKLFLILCFHNFKLWMSSREKRTNKFYFQLFVKVRRFHVKTMSGPSQLIALSSLLFITWKIPVDAFPAS
jgi:hypothetical protein